MSEDGISPVEYRDTEHFRVYREFLNNPERMLRIRWSERSPSRGWDVMIPVHERGYKTDPQTGKAVIVGAGMAGLCCALRLQEKGIPCLLLEASDEPGGRVRTDRVDGFLLDRGFQVLLTAYPEARRVLDYKALRLQDVPARRAGADGRQAPPRLGPVPPALDAAGHAARAHRHASPTSGRRPLPTPRPRRDGWRRSGHGRRRRPWRRCRASASARG